MGLFKKKKFLKPMKVKKSKKRKEILDYLAKNSSLNDNFDIAKARSYLKKSFSWVIHYGCSVVVKTKLGKQVGAWVLVKQDKEDAVKKIGEFSQAVESLISGKAKRTQFLIKLQENDNPLDDINALYKDYQYSWFLINEEHLFICNKMGRCVYAHYLGDASRLYPDE
jgi:hypothetical protein